MAVDPTQAMADAQCILACFMPGMIDAAQLASMAQATITTTKQVALVNGVSQKILDLNLKRKQAVFQNLGVNQVFVGPSTVTNSGSTQGLRLASAAAGAAELTLLTLNTTAEVWAVSNGATTICVIEFLVP